MVLYDLKFRNLTREETQKILDVLFGDEKVFVSERAVSIDLDQEEENRHLWTLMIYHLQPKMMVYGLELVIDAEVYPVIMEVKK